MENEEQNLREEEIMEKGQKEGWRKAEEKREGDKKEREKERVINLKFGK